ncbi:UbiA family prenyltransferase [Halobacterium zhouii]|uniref:UbiA family prenyltransferase n=1 Tax=Halobacterium zhouii TaxID=2902624 RepID=UPI001E4D3FD3|nr:UbiA family prenyltransferase [Halobacterium zhouii]
MAQDTQNAQTAPNPGISGTLAAYAELVRVPNLFTALPDVLLGAALVAAAGGDLTASTVAGLSVASALVYAAGTTLNDYFDASRDARERPERPIPSGRVSRRAAATLGAALLVTGVAVAFAAAGLAATAVASTLVAAVLLYDSVLKGSAVGFLTMGATRTLNVVLGITAAQSLSAPPFRFDAFPPEVLVVPLIVGGYIASVTYMAAEEATGTERRAVLTAGAGTTVAGLAALASLWLTNPGPLALAAGVALVGAFLAWTGRALRSAYADPAPDTVGPAVGTCILALVVLDAAFAAVAGVAWTVVTVAFLVPAVGLSRAFDVS